MFFSYGATTNAMVEDGYPDWFYGYPKKVLYAYFYEEGFSKKLSDQMSKESDLIFRNLSDEEKSAIRNYTGVNNISAFLGGIKFSAEMSETFEKYAKLISGLIDKNHLKEDIILFQGNSLDCLISFIF